MVSWSDFLSANPAAQEWHFVAGLAVVLLAVVLLRVAPVWGVTLLVVFVAFVLIKEVWVASVIEGETANQEVVSAAFWFAGGAVGALTGYLAPKPLSAAVASAGIVLVTALLFLGWV